VRTSGCQTGNLLFQTDAVVHTFPSPGSFTEKVGSKALARFLSDIGWRCRNGSSSSVDDRLPAGILNLRMSRMYRGLTQMAEKFGVAIGGRRTTTTPGCILYRSRDRNLLPKEAILRAERFPDAFFVTGELGGLATANILEFVLCLSEQWLASHVKFNA